MKKTAFFISIIVLSNILFSQNITNTLGTSGVFTIKDGSTTFLTLFQSNGLVGIAKNLTLTETPGTQTGILFKGANRFLHTYHPAGSDGYNTFLGLDAGNFTMLGNTYESSYNTGIGNSSLSSITTGAYNTALGFQSLYSNTTGSLNTALGLGSLTFNTIGNNNTALGFQSLFYNTIGNSNTALGFQSLFYNTEGYQNTAVGYHSLQSNTFGIGNTAVGVQSLFSNNTGNSNTAFGYNSLFTNISGFNNTAIGLQSLQLNTGNYNTALGYNAGAQISTGSNLTCVGSNAHSSSVSATNQITLGDNQITSLRCNVTTITSLSDARDKKNIEDLNLGINFLMKLKPRIYNWDKREWYDDNVSDGTKMQESLSAGFIAQELDEVQTSENAEWLNLVLKDNPDKLEATPGNLLPIVIKAIQELKVESEKLKVESENLKAENDELKKEVESLKSMNEKLARLEQMQNILALEINKMKSKDTEIKEIKLGEK